MLVSRSARVKKAGDKGGRESWTEIGAGCAVTVQRSGKGEGAARKAIAFPSWCLKALAKRLVRRLDFMLEGREDTALKADDIVMFVEQLDDDAHTLLALERGCVSL